MCSLPRLWLLAALATGCASSIGPSTGASGGISGTGSTTSGGTSDAGSQGTSSTGGTGAGAPCDPSAVVTACAAAALICDVTNATCRLPNAGEPCDTTIGCAVLPATLRCEQVSVNDQTESLCLVPCLAADSSGCPYGSSCGDPNLPGFCSAQGTPACNPWSSCTLGPGLSGDCVPDGAHPACFANGSLSAAYAPCDPTVLNSDSVALCSAGATCQSPSLALGVPATGGFCFRFCGADAGACANGEHCDQPGTKLFGLCRPGIPCALDVDTCPTDTACVPDDSSGLSGGCLSVTAASARLGAACALPTHVSPEAPCAVGTCLPQDGGPVCTPLCDLADGGRPYCVNQTCTPLGGGGTQVLGACR